MANSNESAYPPTVSEFGRYEGAFMHPSQIQLEGSELKAIDEHSAPAEPQLTYSLLDGIVQFLQPITAQTDEEAVASWLQQCRSRVTVEHYRKDAERFLMWLQAHGPSLREIVVEDLTAYAVFLASLADLPPIEAERWISPQRWPKSDDRWRPFQGALSLSSQRQALVSVHALLKWLKKVGYLKSAFDSQLVVSETREHIRTRYLPWEAVGILLDAADQMPEKTTAQVRYRARVRFLVCFCVSTGAKLSDLPVSSMSSIYCDSDGRWWWSAPAYEGEVTKIPVPHSLVTELKKYRLAMGMQEIPLAGENAPLIQSLRGPGAADVSSIYASLKRLFKLAADLVHDQDPGLARRLEAASPSWLRNTALARQVEMEFDPRWIQATARHKDINTTVKSLGLDARVSLRVPKGW